MLNQTPFMICALLCGVFVMVLTITMHSEDPKLEKEWTRFCAISGIGMFGSGLDMLNVPFYENIAWCLGYLAVIFFGRWLMRATLREHLQAHAFRYVHEINNPR